MSSRAVTCLKYFQDRSDKLNENRFLNKISKGLIQKGELIAIFTNPQKIETDELKQHGFH